MHPVLFCISVADCILGQIPLGKKALYHLGETIKLLNERLSDAILSVHDSTIWVVLSLVIFFSYLKDFKTAMVHMEGLGHMIKLRGGLNSFREKPRLYLKLGRLVVLPKEILSLADGRIGLTSHTLFIQERTLSC
jgi:hypothetical protein